jgi:hypothetical protein
LPEEMLVSEQVQITENRDYIEITPLNNSNSSKYGLLFYPGGLVDPHAYIGLLSKFALSGNGHTVIIAKMPSNLAVLDINAAIKIMDDDGDLNWVLSGHSLGGAMVCSFAEKNANRIEGLILMASYPAESVDLTDFEGPVLSMVASEDEIIDFDKFENTKSHLPASTKYVVIEGGNHGNFGDYGFQKGDGTASISAETQKDIIVEQLKQYYSENNFE